MFDDFFAQLRKTAEEASELLLPEDLQNALYAGERALDLQDVETAIRKFNRAVNLRESLPAAHFGLARAYAMDDNHEGAEMALGEARRLAPADSDIALFAAEYYLARGALDEAATAARDAAHRFAQKRERTPAENARLARALSLRGLSEQRRGRPDRAVREFKKALSVLPDEIGLHVSLLEAHISANQVSEARLIASALKSRDAKEISGERAERIGLTLFEVGAPEAGEWLRGRDSAKALIARAKLAARRGDHDESETLARMAIGKGGGGAAFVALAETLVATGAGAAAADVLSEAAEFAPPEARADLLRDAVRCAPLDDSDRLTRLAAAIEAVASDDPVARIARALAGDQAITWEELNASSEPRAALAVAQRALHERDPQRALTALDHVAPIARTKLDRADSDRLRELALRQLFERDDGVDLAAAIAVVATFGAERGLRDVERRAQALRDELDRPLLLAVLGEFNAGKSTLINAFIGAEVAPMGIVPTTATLNVLRSGAERMVRVVRRDRASRTGAYADLKALLADAEAETGGIDRVEIVLPNETLERVWILDAPGTNAIDENHTRLAHEAAHRADAVIWVFDARQAGKLTETQMHERLRAEGRLIVPVLNKKDSLKEGELDEVMTVVTRGFGAAPIPIEAKKALKARIAEDDGTYAKSGFPELLAHLEREVFSRSRELKHRACSGRLAVVLDDALAAEAPARAALAQEASSLDAIADSLQEATYLLHRVIEDAVSDLEREQDRTFEAAAEEVLSVVMRSDGVFRKRNVVTREDRSFLIEALSRQLEARLRVCRARLRQEVVRVILTAMEDRRPADLDERVTSVLVASLSAYWGFQRGLLRGGALQEFFDATLPRADLEKAELAAALARSRADARAELLSPLKEAVLSFVQDLGGELRAKAEASREEERRVGGQVFAPLRILRTALRQDDPNS